MRTDAFDPETLEVRNNELKPMIKIMFIFTIVSY